MRKADKLRSMVRTLTALLVAVAASAAPSPADWSSVQALAPGTVVRVSVAKSNVVSGKLERVTETSLVVNSGSASRSIERQTIIRLSVRTKARRRRSMLIGLALGAGGGAALGGAAAAVCSNSLCGGHGAALVAGGIAGAAVIGALIGAAVSHAGWRVVYRQ
jgi:hypothetical protein